MQPNMRLCCMDFGWQHQWAYNGSSCRGILTSPSLKSTASSTLKTQRWHHIKMSSSKYPPGSKGYNSTMFRDNNQATDVLALMGGKHDPVPKNTFLEWLSKPSVVWQDEGKDVGANGPK